MLKIRLRRMGAIRQPHYRIVVADSRAPRDGAFIESLGHYNPLTNPATIQVDVAKYEEWKGKGAQPTDAVVSLVRQFNRNTRAADATAAAQPAAATPRKTREASGRRATPAVAAPVAAEETIADAPMNEGMAEATRDEGEGNEAITGAATEDVAAVDNTDAPLVDEAVDTAAPADEEAPSLADAPAEAAEDNADADAQEGTAG